MVGNISRSKIYNLKFILHLTFAYFIVGKIKRICETELGIVSQCCQPSQAAKLRRPYFENVSLKINVKVWCSLLSTIFYAFDLLLHILN